MTTPELEKEQKERDIRDNQIRMEEFRHYINLGDYYKIKERHFDAIKFWRNEQCQKMLKEINEQ